jgi:hypothetical protein
MTTTTTGNKKCVESKRDNIMRRRIVTSFGYLPFDAFGLVLVLLSLERQLDKVLLQLLVHVV